MQGFPVSSSGSRTVIGDSLGSKSQLYSLVVVAITILTLLFLFWFRYLVKRPGIKRDFAEVRRPAPLDADGNPVFPVGEPYSLSEAMIYEPGITRSDSGEDLLVACPKCSLVRSAAESTLSRPRSRSGKARSRSTR